MRSRPRCAVIAVFLMCGLAGCSGGPDPETPAVSNRQSTWHLDTREIVEGIAQQRRTAGDGVNKAEYLAAIEDVKACLERHDLTLDNDGWNPIDNRSIDLRFGNTKLGDDQVLGYGNDCMRAYLDTVQNEYRVAQKPHMNADVMTSTQACVKNLGIATTGSEKSLSDITDQVATDKIDPVIQCIRDAARQIYPDRAVPIRDQ
jgi:hypothetical protein